VIQEAPGKDREIIKVEEDGSPLPTYEKYCDEMSKDIDQALHKAAIQENGPYESIILEGLYEPSHFETVCNTLKEIGISCAPQTKLIFKDCLFGGARYVNVVLALISATQKMGNVFFEIIVEERNPPRISKDKKNISRISAHDEARFALGNVRFYRNNTPVAIKPFNDDTLVGINGDRLLTKLSAFRSKKNCKLFNDDSLSEKYLNSKLLFRLKNPSYFFYYPLHQDRLTRPEFFVSIVIRPSYEKTIINYRCSMFSHSICQQFDEYTHCY
jgi:hypothetical protein